MSNSSVNSHETLTLTLTARQAQALHALAAAEALPPEIYAAEVLVRHLYHAYTPDVARRTRARPERTEESP